MLKSLSGPRRSLPCEPIRSLDALHLATALIVRNLSPEVQVLSFDDRIRDNATALGLDVVPETDTGGHVPADD